MGKTNTPKFLIHVKSSELSYYNVLCYVIAYSDGIVYNSYNEPCIVQLLK